MTIVYLDAWAIGGTDLGPLRALGELRVYPTTTQGELPGRVREAEVIIANKVRITPEALAQAPACRLVVASATGTDHIDAEACAQRGVAVGNVAGYATESVAQFTLAAALALRGRLRHQHRFVSSGAYSESARWTHPVAGWRELGGRWGIIGLGAIGRRVGELARAFGCETIFYSPSGPRAEVGFTQVSLEELLATSGVVSVHAPGAPRYANLLNADTLARVNPGAVLVAAGRGSTVDEAAVAELLRAGGLFGAAFDVFSREPLPATSPLLSADVSARLLLSPHSAWTSEEALTALVAGLAARVAALVDG